MLLQNLKIILHVAFFPLYNHFMEKQKTEKKKYNSSPFTTKWFTKLIILLQDQESMYLEKYM